MSRDAKKRIRRKQAYKHSGTIIAIVIVVLGWAVLAFIFIKPLIVRLPLASQFFTNTLGIPNLATAPATEGTSTSGTNKIPTTVVMETTNSSSQTANGTAQLTESTLVKCDQQINDLNKCNDSAAPEEKAPAQQSIAELVRISDLHIWVAPDDHASVAAMIVNNQGSHGSLINSISLRGVSVPYNSWYYYKVDPASANNTMLEPDYTPSSVDIDSDGDQETFVLASDPVQLEGGEYVILYLLDPLYLESIDSGLTLNVSVQMGNATKVASTTIVTATGND